jgi:hypothetical protein
MQRDHTSLAQGRGRLYQGCCAVTSFSRPVLIAAFEDISGVCLIKNCIHPIKVVGSGRRADQRVFRFAVAHSFTERH